jgi:hypothetical protein
VDRTDHTPAQHPPGLPEPSYARRLLDAIADVMEFPSNRDRILDEPDRRRIFNLTVATIVTVQDLPDPVANETSEKVARLLPPIDDGTTHSAYAQQLRQLAEAV